MTNRIEEARTELAAAIRARSANSVDRVHAVTPNRVDAPCIFLGGASLDRITVGTPGTNLVIATFPVYCVADGRPDEQTRMLDQMLALVWDGALACGALPNDASPAPIDVGGPSLRGAVVRVEQTITALSLCAPTLEVTTHG